jgi:pyrroline-5-carboxylate reductase
VSAPSVGFVGGGRVARIILGGWARAGVLPRTVTVTDPDQAALEQLTSAVPSVRVAELREVAAADVVLVAVPPPAAVATFARLRDLVTAETIVLSLIPSVPLTRINQELGDGRQVARMIPNAPSVVGAGYNPIAFGSGMSDSAREAVVSLLAPLGRSPEVPDDQLEAYAVLTAMGPTYLWPQLYALADVAQQTGLDPDAAMDGLDAMVEGALRTMTDAGLSPQQVQDLIPSRPLAEPVAAMSAAYGNILIGLHARLAGRAQ